VRLSTMNSLHSISTNAPCELTGIHGIASHKSSWRNVCTISIEAFHIEPIRSLVPCRCRLRSPSCVHGWDVLSRGKKKKKRSPPCIAKLTKVTPLKVKYKGDLKNFTDGNHNVFDPLFNLPKDSWYVMLHEKKVRLDDST